MINVERILKQERLIRAMTGLNRKGFASLLVSFEEAYRQSLIKPESRRQRAIGEAENLYCEQSVTRCFTY
jgi:hypothetical protein